MTKAERERKKEEQERAMRAQIRALRFQVKDLAKTINETLAASRFAGDEDAARAYLAAHPREFDAHRTFQGAHE